ncbi:MAG TPA: hypothetical protein VHV80_11905 [Steroidobacteraceae bacterium]|jgi:hypothetical protein|nr:hypothetical protein [Steroidobacteraceae bacterium]
MATAACALGFLGMWPAANAAPVRAPQGQPALWRTYDMIVNLQNLPRTYTCDQLWYEFHGILLQLGAWPYSVSILPYHCSPSPGGYLRSPDVEARFQLPIFLHGAAAKSAPAKAIERAVRLAPGEPKILQTSDCQLLQQIAQTMLASIEARVDATHFDCAGSPGRASKFSVTVSLPVAVKMPSLAATEGSGPH